MPGDPGIGGAPEIAFGFGGSPTGDFQPTPPSMQYMQGIIDATQQVATNLAGKINACLMQVAAESAVTANMLGQRVYDSSQAALADCEQTLQQLQEKIQLQSVSDLGSILEQTIPLGVKPPQPDETCPIPDCVQIRNEALANVYASAVVYYKCAGYPLRYSDPMGRLKVLDFIQNCLQGLASRWETIANIINDIDNAPPTYQPQGIGTGTQLEQPDIGIPSPALNPAPDLSVSPIVPATGAIGTPRDDLPGTLPLGGSTSEIFVPVGGSVTINPGDFIQTATQADGTAGVKITQAGVATALAPSAVGTQGPWGPWIPSPNIPPQGPPTQPIFPQCPPGTHWLPQTSLCSNGSMPQCPPGYFYDPATGLCYQGHAGTTQPPPATLPAQTGPCPAPCPPPPVTINIKTCETPTPKPSPKPPEKPCPDPRVCIYKTDAGLCYMVAGTVNNPPQPNSGSDRQLYCGNPSGMSLAEICSTCGTTQQEQEASPELDFGVAPVTSTGCEQFGPVPGVKAGFGGGTLAQFFGIQNPDGSPFIPFPDAGELNIPAQLANNFVGIATKLLTQFLDLAGAVITNSPCAGGDMQALQLAGAAMNFLQQWGAGDAFMQAQIPNRQNRSFLCPVNMPDHNNAAEAWLANSIDYDTAVCWTRAANFRDDLWGKVINARRSKFSALQWGSLLLREKIDNAEFAQHIRELGFIKDYDPQAVIDLLQQIPPPSDIIRMMVRDSADEINIDWTQEDGLFPQKYLGQLKSWGKNQGIPDEYMKMLWRAHFSIPSPGQLYNMLHRLSTLPAGDPNYVDPALVRNALIQQDISPKWVDKLMAISFNLLTRRDIQNAYQTNSISDQDAIDAYVKLGFDKDSIHILLDSGKKRRNQTFARRPEVRMYAAGLLTRTEYEDALRNAGADDAAVGYADSQSSLLRNAAMRKSCGRSYRKRYLTGDIDKPTVIDRLVSLGIEDSVASVIAAGWECEAAARGREVSAGAVNQLYQGALIDEGQYVARLMRLGFDNDDAVILLRNQQRLLNIKQTKAQQQVIKQQQAEQARLQRMLDKAARQAVAAENRVIRAAAKARSVKQLREKRLIEAAEKYQKLVGGTLPDAILYIRQYYNAIVGSQPVTRDEAIAALLLTASDKSIQSQADYQAGVAAALTVQVPLE